MIIISFFLDGILSNYLSIPLFTLTSIVLSSLYIKQDKLLKYSLIIGILYDITYTNTLILNGLIYFLLCFIIFNFNKKTKLINLFIINIIVIILYLVITSIILLIFKYIKIDTLYFLLTILKAIIINNIYLLIIYLIKRKSLHKI